MSAPNMSLCSRPSLTTTGRPAFVRRRREEAAPVRLGLKIFSAQCENVLELLGGVLQTQAQILHHCAGVVRALFAPFPLGLQQGLQFEPLSSSGRVASACLRPFAPNRFYRGRPT